MKRRGPIIVLGVALVAVVLYLVLAFQTGGLEWRDKVLTVRNTTGEVVGVLRYRDLQSTFADRTVLQPGETGTVRFAGGNTFQVCALDPTGFGYLQVDSVDAVYFKPQTDSSVVVVPGEGGGFRFELSLPAAGDATGTQN